MPGAGAMPSLAGEAGAVVVVSPPPAVAGAGAAGVPVACAAAPSSTVGTWIVVPSITVASSAGPLYMATVGVVRLFAAEIDHSVSPGATTWGADATALEHASSMRTIAATATPTPLLAMRVYDTGPPFARAPRCRGLLAPVEDPYAPAAVQAAAHASACRAAGQARTSVTSAPCSVRGLAPRSRSHAINGKERNARRLVEDGPAQLLGRDEPERKKNQSSN